MLCRINTVQTNRKKIVVLNKTKIIHNSFHIHFEPMPSRNDWRQWTHSYSLHGYVPISSMLLTVPYVHGKINKFDRLREKNLFEVVSYLNFGFYLATKNGITALENFIKFPNIVSGIYRYIELFHICPVLSAFLVRIFQIIACCFVCWIHWKWRIPLAHCYIMLNKIASFVVFLLFIDV